MTHNPTLLQDMLSNLDLTGFSEPDRDLRQEARVRRQAALSIELADAAGESNILVELKDLSPAGMGFTFWQPINPGQRFCIELPMSNGQQVAVACKVVNCRQMDDGAYRIGATFLRTIAKPSRRRG